MSKNHILDKTYAENAKKFQKNLKNRQKIRENILQKEKKEIII